jgi:photosystem II stability/assembly factor-like uncharacterized protein
MSLILNLRKLVVCLLMCSLVLSGLLTLTTRQGHASDSLFHSSTTDETVERATPPPETAGEAERARASEAYGKLSLSFEANHDQFDRQVKFRARGGGHSLFLTASEAVLLLIKPDANKAKGRRANSPAARQTRVGGLRSRSRGAEGLRKVGEADKAAPTVTVLRMRLEGANSAPQIEGMDELPGKTNYFIGNNPRKWRTDIPSYSSVIYRDVYTGIDLVYYGRGQQLEYDFRIAPGSDPSQIKLTFEGAQTIEVNAQGDLVLHTKGGDVRQHKPLVYQEVDGAKKEVQSRYILKDQQHVGFQIEAYDAGKPLVIDPVLSYSTFLGGGGDERGYGIAVDTANNMYITGRTSSPNFPVKNPLQGDVSFSTEAFVTKLNAAGTAFVYSTYLGGRGDDEGNSIAVDAGRNAYVTGMTAAADFPLVNPLQARRSGFNDAFVTKLNPQGTAILYSTYLGGTGYEHGYGIALDSAGNAYVAGETSSVNFPTTSPFQATKRGHQAFKSIDGGSTWNSSDNGLNAARINDLAIDPVNPAILYVATTGWGVFKSTDGGNTWKAVNRGLTNVSEVNDVVIDPANHSTVYAGTSAGLFKSTDGGSLWRRLDLGGSSQIVYALVVDPVHTSTIYAGGDLGGLYKSTDGGNTWTSHALASYPPDPSVYALAIDPQRPSTLFVGTYSGGVFKSTDGGINLSFYNSGIPYSVGSVNALAVDPVRPSNVYIGFSRGGIYKSSDGGGTWKGATLGLPASKEISTLAIDPAHPATLYAGTDGSGLFKSTNGGNSWSASEMGLTNRVIGGIAIDPTSTSTVYTAASSGTDAFITKLNPTGTAYLYSTYLGGDESDQALGIALDGDGHAYVTGATFSTNFPTANPIQVAFASPDSELSDAFVTKLDATGSNLSYSTYLGGNGHDQGNSIAVDSGGNAYVTGFVGQLDVPVNFPLTPGAFQTTFGTTYDFTTDGFVTKVNAAGSRLVYSTYLGGNEWDEGQSIAVDSAGQAVVTGRTTSHNFPLANPSQRTLITYDSGFIGLGQNDAFVTRLNASGSSLAFSTYLGNGASKGHGIALDADKNIYVVGETYDRHFPTVKALQRQIGGMSDAFVTRFGPDSSAVRVSGWVRHENGNTLNQVGMILTGNGTEISVKPDSHGNYSFSVPRGGSYTIKPTLLYVYYDFTPPSRSYTNLLTNQTSQNFVAAGYKFSIYGQAVDIYGGGVSGVKLTLSGARTGTCTTDYSGACTFTDLPQFESYKVTPSAPGATFDPAYQSFSPLFTDETASFDVAYSISGQIRGANGLGISNVTVSLSGISSATTTTDSNGRYRFANVLAGGDYTVTPSRAGMTFSPAFTDIYALYTPRTVNFQPLVSITGKVRITGTSTGIANVVMSLSGSRTTATRTNADGIYTFANLPAGGDYTVTPSKSGYTFNPPSRTFTHLTMSKGLSASYFDGTP